MRYNLVHSFTQGTTGFYACEPDPDLDLAEAMRLLASRPYDSFLEAHSLKKLARSQKADSLHLLAQFASEPALAGFFAKAAALLPDLAGFFPNRPLPDTNPANVLRADLKAACLANINEHAPLNPALIAGDADIAAQREIFAARRSMLRREYALTAARGAKAVEQAPDPRETYRLALERLAKAGYEPGAEMRHEASLSPIALLREWRVSGGVAFGPQEHEFSGKATAYGRGLSLAQARVSCVMEIVERASAHVMAEKDNIGGHAFISASYQDLLASGRRALDPVSLGAEPAARAADLCWIACQSAGGREVFAPAQAIYLFLNLDEPQLFENYGSTGLGAGASPEHAKYAALCEVIERDAQASAPFDPASCFELASDNEIIAGLLADYRWRGIRVQFQDITTEIGVPAYRCFVQGADGGVAQASAASLSGPKAALAALTETPWPYRWATPERAPSGPGLANLPTRKLEDLPDYSLGDYKSDLQLLEKALAAMGLDPVYANLARPELGFPVYRVFVEGLETDTELEKGPSRRFLARIKEI